MSEFKIQHLVNEISGNNIVDDNEEISAKKIDKILAKDKSIDFQSALNMNPRKATPSLNADRMKAFLLRYFRFEKQIKHVATEVMYADVFYYRKTKRLEYSVEVEIKISKSDFKADFKKDKHFYYNHNEEYRFIQPDYFYYAFPDDLFTKEELANIKLPSEKYGILLMNKDGYTWVTKTAKRLTTSSNPRNLEALINRMGSEIATLWLRRENIE